MPEGLTQIGHHAFAGFTNAALTELTLPSTLYRIGDKAIRISHLETLTCLYEEAPTLGTSSIPEHAELLTIIYPCGKGLYYVNNWAEYFHYLTPACDEAKPDFAPHGELDYRYDPKYIFSGYSGLLRIYGSGPAAFYFENLNNQPWYLYRNLITSLVVEDGITGIGGHLCNSLTELTSVSLPTSVQYIGNYAFANCPKLPSITIPASVLGVNDYAFQNCTGLKSITCLATTPPAGTALAFDGVSKSIPVYVPAASIEAYKAADQWKDFTNILAIPEPVSLGDGTNLQYQLYPIQDGQPQKALVITLVNDYNAATMPDYNVDEDGDKSYPGWYSERENIASISLPENLTNIGNHAFAGMTNAALTELTIPSTVTSIGDKAIRISHLETLTCLRAYPHPLTPSYAVTYYGNSCITEHAEDFSIVYPCGDGNTYVNSLPQYYHYLTPSAPCAEEKPDYTQGGSLGSGSNYAFSAKTGVLTISGSGGTGTYLSVAQQLWAWYRNLITSVVIESGISYISPYTFDGLTELTSVSLPSTLRSISEYAFANCSKLSSLTIPASVGFIDDYAFQNCTSLASITSLATTPPVPNTLDHNTQAFDGVTKSIPVYVPAIGIDEYKVADQWKDFTNIQVNTANITAQGTIENTSLSWALTNEGELVIIGSGAMPDYNMTSKQPWKDYRSAITSVIIGSSVTAIGRNSFAECANLVSVTFKGTSTVTSIGREAFKSCTSLASITIPKSVVTIDREAFQSCTALASVSFEMPTSLTTVGLHAFQYAPFTSIEFPYGVTDIGSAAIHSNGNLTSVTLPYTLEHLGTNNFKGCPNLATIDIKATTPPTFQVDDDYEYPDFIIKYPNETETGRAYANAQGWILLWDKLYNASTNAHAPVPAGGGACGKDGGNNVNYTFGMTLKDGGNATKLADYEGTLTIFGSGEMDDYDLLENTKLTPWYHTYTKLIHHINIESGVTHIAGTTFMSTSNVKTYNIPSTVTYIGPDAFYECNNPEAEVFISANPANLEWWDNNEGAGLDPDDFLWYEATPFGQADIFHVQSTKCYVPSEYLAAYKAKWAKDPDTEKTNVNVYFASRMWDGETKAGMEKILDDTHGQTVPVVTLVRPLNRDGYFATLCLPFSMTADQIQYSSLAKAEIKEFTNATVSGETLNIEFSPVTSIEAGKPYFVKFANPADLGDALDRLDFMNVVIDKTAPQEVTHGGLTMTGTFVPKAVSAQESATDGEGVLFLGPSNRLYWPSTDGNIKPFRAYFSISSSTPSPIRRGMPARIVEREDTATGVGEVESQKSNGEIQKVIENGQLIIIRNGEKFNAQGQIVK